MSSSILVVEDDDALRPVLVEVLREEGYAVEEAANGDRALQHARETFFDLIITDVRMEGMDGLETAEAVHRIQPDVPVIVVTGYAHQDVPLRAIRQGAFDYLFKPFHLRELIVCVESALNNQKLLEELENEMSGLSPEGHDKTGQARIFRKFFIGVRSGALDRVEAYGVWEMLELAGSEDANYEKAEEVLDSARFSLLLSNDDASTPHDFTHLFEQIKLGKVNSQEIFIAPRLRRLPQERLAERFPVLAEVQGRLWGKRIS